MVICHVRAAQSGGMKRGINLIRVLLATCNFVYGSTALLQAFDPLDWSCDMQRCKLLIQVEVKDLQYFQVSFISTGWLRIFTQSGGIRGLSVQRFSRAGPRGRGREWATLGVHLLSWLLSNNRLEKVPVVSVPHTSSNRLLLSNQDKGCTPSVAHSLPLPLGPALLNLSIFFERGVPNLQKKLASIKLHSLFRQQILWPPDHQYTLPPKLAKIQ